ncbi:hypothetical protein K458DRAFT_393583 [Lentithecium fluviatile CBS 122367]|uniref:Uncharacterized protein n=1 Tax=Lentithecium fluviatile CBS 122367 TaxID=1168545 RepID=A0A6G1IP70_9PLEO|nr:hypothetical protein K458DRAFT_393583 [Lentithecium fluviatile CBS 122367]
MAEDSTKTPSHAIANESAYSANTLSLDFSGFPTSQSALPTSYTPERMKQVLSDALSPLPTSSPILHQHSRSPQAFDPAHHPGSARSPSSDSNIIEGSFMTPQKRWTSRSHNLDNDKGRNTQNTPHLAPESSPVRPSPARNAYNQTFEVDASFIQAMVGLLERQANIVPDHMLTESEVRRIVRKELDKRLPLPFPN